MMRILAVLALLTLALSSLIGCGNGAPQAKFKVTPNGGYAPLEVQFTDQSTGNVTAWEWDFNDDGVVDSTEQNPLFTYENVGNYTISLYVSGRDGNSTEVKADYIKVIPCPRFADFIAEPTSGVGVTTVQFTDKSTGNVTGWTWDFDSDGVIDSTVQNPTYTYSRNGLYSVTLTITTTICTDTITRWDYIDITGCHT
jgi:PKD repeat protein